MQGVRFRSSKTQTRLTSCQIPDDLIQSLQNCGLGAVAEVGPLQQLIDEAGADGERHESRLRSPTVKHTRPEENVVILFGQRRRK